MSAGSASSSGPAGPAGPGGPARDGAAAGGPGAEGAAGAEVGSALAIDTLLAGDCFDESASSMGTGTVALADCAVPHTAEVVQVHPLDAVFGDAHPGRRALAAEAEEHCAEVVGRAVAASGLDGAGLEYTYYHPTEANWEAGSRLVQCNLTSASGLVGSLTAGTLSAW
nr:septum formation family protein [Kineococcus vitellinus]